MRKALFVFCVVLAAGCFLYVGGWFLDGQMQKDNDSRFADEFHGLPVSADSSAEPADTATEPRDFGQLVAINHDVIGWITIDGTAVDYPVVRGEDNEHYLNVEFKGDNNKRGSIFMDYRCANDSSNKIIYGHHMKDGTMFHDLALYQEPNFSEEHPDIRFYPLEGDEGVYRVVDVLYWDTAENHSESFFEHMSKLDYGGGKLLILTTCDNAAINIRIIVVARMAA